MLFPVGVSVRTQQTGYVTNILILVSVVVYVVQLFFLSEDSYFRYGIVPIRFLSFFTEYVPIESLALPLLTHMFLHADIVHLILNLWVLWIFGENLEDSLGHARFLLLYLAGGMGAALPEIALAPYSEVPMIGASGAIAGVMGAYCMRLRFVRVRVLVFLFFVVFFSEIPSLYFFAFWFAVQLISGTQALLGSEAFRDIAWWCHVGGFLIGLLAGRVAKSQRNFL